MNQVALSKLKECLQLASEFVKDENTYQEQGICMSTSGGCIDISSVGIRQSIIKKRSNDIRNEAEQKALKLEKQEKCANLIKECLEYLTTVNKFENTTTACDC